MVIENDGDLTSEDKRTALNAAFELAIQLNRFVVSPSYNYLLPYLIPCRPQIFQILAENGAQKDSVNLQRLYLFSD